MEWKAKDMIKSIKQAIRSIKTAQVMRRLDKQFFRLEVAAFNAAKSIEATNRVMEAIEDGSMR